MTRFWPRSLMGQVLLAVAIALLVAQAISAVLLFRAADSRRDQAALNAIAFRLVSRNEAERRDSRPEANDRRSRRGDRASGRADPGPDGFSRALRVDDSAAASVFAGEQRVSTLETDLVRILEREGVAARDVAVVRREARRDPFVRERPRLLRRLATSDNGRSTLLVASIRVDGSDSWQIARALKPGAQDGALGPILFQTALIFVLLVGLLYALLRRITRPLAILTQRTESFGSSSGTSAPLAPEGPDDIRRLINAHTAMEARISALLDEKDVMLGAIGHDLKTPLAALRVRIESVENDDERSKMARSIEDITQTLDDILSLARIGRASEPPEKAELSSLLASVVEEFEDLGQPVELVAGSRMTASIQVTWLRRAMRNLIDNALRYGGSARTGLETDGQAIILWVEDDGPGIPEAAMATIMEPFTRGESSRNRQTGGAGLGLTLARAIAEQHGGALRLANRADGGLRAEIRLLAARQA